MFTLHVSFTLVFSWTVVDMQIVCKELGLTGGEYWTWVDHYNDTKQLLWEKPRCLGVEQHVKECSNWAGRQLGAGVCGMKLVF